jgi:diguanylate cyclase (GGDEF)-like protein
VEVCRETDEVARLGGDEFVVLLRECGPVPACKVAAKILDRIEEIRIPLDATRRARLSISIGIASRPDHARSLHETLLLADLALLKAKEAGRNRFAMYDTAFEQACCGDEAPVPVAQDGRT